MLSALATSLASSASSAACFTHAPMLGAVGAAMAHLRPWLASRQQRRGVAAQAALSMLDSDSDAEQQPALSVLSQPPAVTLEKPAPIPAVQGRIHSVDTFSAVDGPGLRMVVFEQVRRRRAAMGLCCTTAPLRTTAHLVPSLCCAQLCWLT